VQDVELDAALDSNCLSHYSRPERMIPYFVSSHNAAPSRIEQKPNKTLLFVVHF
jgi:hypothetical protein